MLSVQIHFQDKEMAALRKENIEISANVRQLLSRVPHANRAHLDLQRPGGGSAPGSPGKDLHAGPRSPSKAAALTRNTRETREACFDGVESSSAAREAELIAGGHSSSSSRNDQT